jgi:hypothetical protein
MDERNSLNSTKRTIAADTVTRLDEVMLAVFQWQMRTRGCSPRPAYEETTAELEHLLESVKAQVIDTLQREYLRVR